MPQSKVQPQPQSENSVESAESTAPIQEEKYLHITPHSYLYVSPSLNVVLYPGVSAVCTQSQFDQMDSALKPLLTVKEVSADEFKELFKKQGILGIIKD